MGLTIRGRSILQFYDHYLCRLDYENLQHMDEGRLEHYDISVKNLDTIWATPDIRSMVSKQPEYVYGLGFRDQDGNVVGNAFMMAKGGSEVLYKIRTIDAYIFAVRVFKPYQGQGYSHEIVTRIIEEDRRRRGSSEFHLTVEKSSFRAIKCYKRLGFEIIGTRTFYRIPKIDLNLPYYTL